jgi:hypothetical protein
MKSFNQIQYVNRVFHEETVGLEFKYNDIVFEDGGGRSAARRRQIVVNEVLGRDYAQYLKLCFANSKLVYTLFSCCCHTGTQAFDEK